MPTLYFLPEGSPETVEPFGVEDFASSFLQPAMAKMLMIASSKQIGLQTFFIAASWDGKIEIC